MRPSDREAYLSFALSALLSLLLVLFLFVPFTAHAQSVAAASAFRPGDRIILVVEGEKALTDTFTVRAGPAIDLPSIGAVSLIGVPPDSVQGFFVTTIGRYVKATVVHAKSLVRVGVLGEVATPGFYSVPPEGLASDAFTAAGGPTKDAAMNKARIERDGQWVVSPDSLRRGITRGLTLSQLGVHSGDQVVVPKTDPDRTLKYLGLALAIPAAIYAIVLVRR